LPSRFRIVAILLFLILSMIAGLNNSFHYSTIKDIMITNHV